MEIQLAILLLGVGSLGGALYATTRISGTLLTIPTILMFMPVLGFQPSLLLVSVIATCVCSFVPVLLLEWLQDMKQQKVEFALLTSLAPGAAMGGVIGAQVVSFMGGLFFKLALSMVFLVLLFNLIHERLVTKNQGAMTDLNNPNRSLLRMPIGLFVGMISIMAGGTGRALSELWISTFQLTASKISSTAAGIAFFVSVSSLVGFVFPAKELGFMGQEFFVGSIQVVAFLLLAVTQIVFFWLCRNKGNHLDRSVLKFGFAAFMAVCLFRLWFMAI